MTPRGKLPNGDCRQEGFKLITWLCILVVIVTFILPQIPFEQITSDCQSRPNLYFETRFYSIAHRPGLETVFTKEHGHSIVMAEAIRSPRKNPFSTWMKKLANLKHSSNKTSSKTQRDTSPQKPSRSPNKRCTTKEPLQDKETYGNTSDRVEEPVRSEPQHNGSFTSLPVDEDGQHHMAASNRSAAPTLGTIPDTIHSNGAHSKATGTTIGGGMSSHSGGGNSIFSSSNQSARSLTTTLTTIQSTAPSAHLTQLNGNSTPDAQQRGHQSQSSQGSTYFSHQFPTTSQQYPTTPASAIPPHLQPATSSHLPATYRSATANNLLTDNASVLTLASSGRNGQRRGSVDTNASVRAIAPSSQWGGSRESLPLSVLSQTTESNAGPAMSMHHTSQKASLSGITKEERASVYSSSGVTAPALSSERNSVYAGRTGGQGMDGGSIKQTGEGGSLAAGDGSSLRGGGYDSISMRRNDSIAGSIGGIAASPVASPKFGDVANLED